MREDLTREWGDILTQRLAMYHKLREEAQAAATPAGHDAFYQSYVRLVDLVKAGPFCGTKAAVRFRPLRISGTHTSQS